MKTSVPAAYSSYQSLQMCSKMHKSCGLTSDCIPVWALGTNERKNEPTKIDWVNKRHLRMSSSEKQSYQQ